MRELRLKFIALLALLTLVAAGFGALAGDGDSTEAPVSLSPVVIRVGSTYENEPGPLKSSNPRSKDLEGTGFLVDIPGIPQSQFVLTASHVSQGRDLWIQLPDGTPLTPGARLADTVNDVEVIEVPRSKVLSIAVLDFKDDSLCSVYNPEDYSDHPRFRRMNVVAGEGVSRIPFGSWATLGMEDAYHLTSFPEGLDLRFHESVLGDEIISKSRISPKMSGSPLIDYAEKDYTDKRDHGHRGKETCNPHLLHIRGLAKQYNNILHKSYFVPERTLVAFLKKMVANRLIKKEQAGVVHWRMRSGLLFRDLGQDSDEANFIRQPTAGEREDSGGSKGDRGDGSGSKGDRGDGGGDRGDGGGAHALGAIDPTSIFQKFASTKQLALKQFGARPGMNWRGQSVIAFAAKSKVPKNFPDLVLTANLSALKFMKLYPDFYDFEPIPTEKLDLVKLLRQKMTSRQNNPLDLVYEQPYKKTNPQLYDHGIAITDQSVDLRFNFGAQTVYFQIASSGTNPESTDYVPIMTVPAEGPRSEPLLVDVSNLFMVDIGELGSHGFTTKRDRLQEIVRAYERLTVKLVNAHPKERGFEMTINFKPTSPAKLECDPRFSLQTKCQDDKQSCPSDGVPICSLSFFN